MGLLGAHMSIAGGLHKAVERGDSLGCEAIQIFTQSSRTWAIPILAGEEAELFRRTFQNAKTVKRVVAHNSYLLNLSTENGALRRKSVDYFIKTLERCETLRVESLITHPGSHLGAGEASGIALTAESINEVLKSCAGFRARVLLENTAGQGDCVGYRFDHLKAILERIREPERVGFCFDTEHAFAAGYDLRTEEAYTETMAEWERQLGPGRIEAFHLNDAVKELGCRVDRHQNIGKGFLGAEAFRPLMQAPQFANVPMCLETDPGEEMENWKRELELLRLLAAGDATPPPSNRSGAKKIPPSRSREGGNKSKKR